MKQREVKIEQKFKSKIGSVDDKCYTGVGMFVSPPQVMLESSPQYNIKRWGC